MDTNEKSFKKNIRGRELSYSDDFFKFKGEHIVSPKTFSYNTYEVFKNIIDEKTNNYSYLFLTDEGKISDWIDVQLPDNSQFFKTEKTQTTVCPLIFSDDDEKYYLSFGEYNLNDVPSEYVEPIFNEFKTAYIDEQNLFVLTFSSKNICYISHNCGSKEFFLTYEGDEVFFSSQKQPFFYESVTTTSIKLFTFDKNLVNKKYFYIDNGNLILTTDSSKAFTVTFESPKLENLKFLINERWVKYKKENISGEIESVGNLGELKSQILLHSEYNDSQNVNFFPLKNHISYKGNTITKGSSEPDVDFRKYTSINSGFNQELGDQNLSFNYLFTDQEYNIEQGKTVEIDTTPLNLSKEVNINDSHFIQNGAFGSDVPWFADKFNIKNPSLQKLRGAKYLCTWLKKENLFSSPTWVDRYYNPSKLSQNEALLYSTDEYITDIPSELTIKKDSSYKYHRLSKTMVDEAMNKMGDDVINVVKNEKGKKVNLVDEIIFDGDTWRKIEPTGKSNVNSFTFNTDIYIDPTKKIGLQLFGDGVDKGFSIKNRTDLSPYSYFASSTTIYLLNNSGEISNQLDIKEIYGDTIYRFVIGDVFSNIIVITEENLYVLSYDLKVLSRISIIGDNDEPSIYNFTTTQSLVDENGVKLVSYPFTDLSCEIDVSTYWNNNISSKKYQKIKKNMTTAIEITKPVITTSYSFDISTYTTGVFISSSLCDIISQKNSVFYNNNLYIPKGDKVLKIIFCPDDENDEDVFTEVIRETYPAAARFLSDDNVYYYQKNKGTTESIFIDKLGRVFAFDFDTINICPDGDTILGQYDTQKKIIYAVSLTQISKGKSNISTYIKSDFDIEKFRINEKGELAIVHQNASDTQSGLMFKVYDRTKALKYKLSLSGYKDIISLDAYTYINQDDEEKRVLAIIIGSSIGLFKLEYDCEEKTIKRKYLSSLPNTSCSKFTEMVNNQGLTRFGDSNILYLNLISPSKYIFDNNISTTIPIEKFERGWYNINISIDLLTADFTILLNDKLYKRITGDSSVQTSDNTTYNKFFKPLGNINLSQFDHTFFLGACGISYGITLNNILKNGTDHDPYCVKNTQMQNTYFITKVLSLHEYQALRLINSTINPITLTISNHKRHNLDEIERMFRYSSGGSISNDINITIDSTLDLDSVEKEKLSTEIKEELTGKMDALNNIKKINIL